MEAIVLVVFHLTSLIVSLAVAALLYPAVREGLKLKNGLVFEMGRGLLLPPAFVAAFCFLNTLMDLGYLNTSYDTLFHALADTALIATSLSLLFVAYRLRNYVRKMGE